MLAYLTAHYQHRVSTGWYAASDRKLRLFACACARSAWSLLDAQSRKAVEQAEALCDSLAGWESDLTQALQRSTCLGVLVRNAATAAQTARHHAQDALGQTPASQAAFFRDIIGNPWRPVEIEWRWFGPCECPSTLREPGLSQYKAAGHLRPSWATCGRSWREARRLAQAAYEERPKNGALDPDCLAVLADALEEAECTESTLLDHLRSWERCPDCRGESGYRVYCKTCQDSGRAGWVRIPRHVRGCFVVDLLLGKE